MLSTNIYSVTNLQTECVAFHRAVFESDLDFFSYTPCVCTIQRMKTNLLIAVHRLPTGIGYSFE